MKKKIMNIFLLSIIGLGMTVPIKADLQNEIKLNQKKIKSDNPNNHYMIDYNYTSFGNFFLAEVVENDSGQYIDVYNIIMNLYLNDPYTITDFDNSKIPIYLSLYDTTNGNADLIQSNELVNGVDYWTGRLGEDEQYVNVQLNGNSIFDSHLEEFHQYRLAFNINVDDDMTSYSFPLKLAVPELTTFTTVSTEDSITIDYGLTISPTSTFSLVSYTYNDIYIKINNKKYDLGVESTGEITSDGLKPAKQYSVTFGFDSTKSVGSTNQYNVSHEYFLEVSTLMPSNFGSGVIIISLILLIILIIIILILVAIILYWNHQRRKINGLALVVGEDGEAYDPVYNYNYYQEENQDTSNKDITYDENNEEYGISTDDGYDGHYYNEDEYVEDYEIDDYENAHEDFDEMEEWK